MQVRADSIYDAHSGGGHYGVRLYRWDLLLGAHLLVPLFGLLRWRETGGETAGRGDGTADRGRDGAGVGAVLST